MSSSVASTSSAATTWGDSVSEGTVLEWHKAEGDSVAADETLVEISTDKVDAEVPAPVDGTVVKVHAAEGGPGHRVLPEGGEPDESAVEREIDEEQQQPDAGVVRPRVLVAAAGAVGASPEGGRSRPGSRIPPRSRWPNRCLVALEHSRPVE